MLRSPHRWAPHEALGGLELALRRAVGSEPGWRRAVVGSAVIPGARVAAARPQELPGLPGINAAMVAPPVPLPLGLRRS